MSLFVVSDWSSELFTIFVGHCPHVCLFLLLFLDTKRSVLFRHLCQGFFEFLNFDVSEFD